MKPAPFAFVRPQSLDAAFDAWHAAGPEAKLLAGGQSLLASLAFRLSQPPALIDISRIEALRGVRHDGDKLVLGALVTHREIAKSKSVGEAVPLLPAVAQHIAHPAIRNRGTIGGSLAFADPAAEWPAAMVALDATLVLKSKASERRVAARQFFQGLYTTTLADFELIAAVELQIDAVTQRHGVIEEIARRSGDYAMAGLILTASLDGGRISRARPVFFGVGDVPVLAACVGEALAGYDGKTSIDDAVAAVALDLDPQADPHGGADMKQQLARVLLKRAVARLLDGNARKAA